MTALTNQHGDEVIGKVVVDRQTTAGRLEIAVIHDCGSAWVRVNVDDKQVQSTLGIAKMQQAREINGQTATHYVGRKPQFFAVFANEAAAIEAAIEEVYAIVAATPEGLLDQRRELIRDISIARDVDGESRDRAWSREDEAGAMVVDRGGRIAAAQKALADFDAAHPEIKAQWDIAQEAKRSNTLQSQIDYRGE